MDIDAPFRFDIDLIIQHLQRPDRVDDPDTAVMGRDQVSVCPGFIMITQPDSALDIVKDVIHYAGSPGRHLLAEAFNVNAVTAVCKIVVLDDPAAIMGAGRVKDGEVCAGGSSYGACQVVSFNYAAVSPAKEMHDPSEADRLGVVGYQ